MKILIILLTMLASCCSLAEKIKVKVGAGVRPPFLLGDGTGLGPEIITVYNFIQAEFEFELIPTPISRRVMSLQEG